MRIAVVGTGYVGLVSGAGFADFGNEVVCVDVDESKVEALARGEIPFYEPGLPELVARNMRERRLRFTTSLEEATRWAQVVFICVGTPQGDDGSADLRYVNGAAATIASSIAGYRLVVQKSTVPVGTADRISALMRKHSARGATFDLASNPEFLRQGSAVENFMRPDRVVIGADSDRARKILREIYAPLYLIETPMVVTSVRTAELIKYAANSLLATKISFINEMANLCEAVGADVHDVAKGVGLCHFAKKAGVPMRIVSAVVEVNNEQRKRAARKILEALRGRAPHTVAVLGLTFKPDTDDLRAAPSLDIIRILLRRGVRVRVFDPVVHERVAGVPRGVTFASDPYNAAKSADALAIVTEWNEFRRLDLARVRRAMRGRAIVDLRNVYDPRAVRRLGFEYTSMGRP